MTQGMVSVFFFSKTASRHYSCRGERLYKCCEMLLLFLSKTSAACTVSCSYNHRTKFSDQARDLKYVCMREREREYLYMHMCVCASFKARVHVCFPKDDIPELAESFLVNITSVELIGGSVGAGQPSVKRPGMEVAEVTIQENDDPRGFLQFIVSQVRSYYLGKLFVCEPGWSDSVNDDADT